jgi:hypothetical protein
MSKRYTILDQIDMSISLDQSDIGPKRDISKKISERQKTTKKKA